ncbi:MAG: ATP phosphoribosyltransferase regulatory subunit, partial [Flavobacteriaceae bacterium]|nr:ATP phosphoribosyltransferase regulatory subunit [Flavobacteriaceae bacterium]
KGISNEAIEKVKPLFSFNGSNQEKLQQLAIMLSNSEEGLNGVEELRFVIESIEDLGLKSAILELDVTLARGLNYYTGAIFEVQTNKVKMGSIGGGGRYDDLTGVFGLKDISGVGISFGLDRIYLVLEELNLFGEAELPKPQVIFLNFDENDTLLYLKAIKKLRENNIKCELYPDLAQSKNQQKKQWKYATNREIKYVVSKTENDLFTLKNMKTGDQTLCNINDITRLINK